jgi:hypothetical protein
MAADSVPNSVAQLLERVSFGKDGFADAASNEAALGCFLDQKDYFAHDSQFKRVVAAEKLGDFQGFGKEINPYPIIACFLPSIRGKSRRRRGSESFP